MPGSPPPTRPDRRVGTRELADLLRGWQHPRHVAARTSEAPHSPEAPHSSEAHHSPEAPRSPEAPKYQALADRLRLLVLDGRLPVHALLPSERDLAAATGTSRTTTTAAYRLLRECGFATSRHGSGTWTSLPGPADRELRDGGEPSLISSGGDPRLEGRYDLATAAPSAPPELHAAYTAALEELPRYLPGSGYLTAGVPALRERVAARYTARGLDTSPDEILVTSGALHGLHLALRALTGRGDRVLVEDPTYPLAVQAMREHGTRPVPWPVEDGWDTGRLREILRQTSPRAAYLIPDFHNPTGALLGSEGRERLATALADAGCAVVVDETMVDLDLRDAGEHEEAGQGTTRSCATDPPPPPMPPPLAALLRSGTGVCVGSASKSFWGGLRVGWIRADRSTVRRLALARAGGDLAGPPLEQLATTYLMDDATAVLTRRRRELAQRCWALRHLVETRLPEWSATVPDGGLALWYHLPEPRSSVLAVAARPLGVVISPGPGFGVTGGFEARLRLPFTRPVRDLYAAVRLLARAWEGPAPGGERPTEPVPVV